MVGKPFRENIPSIADQGRALCQTKCARSDLVVRMTLPFLNLTISADSSDYLALCRHALIDDALHAADESSLLHILVADQQTRQDIAPPAYDAAAMGLGALIADCEAAGLNGCYDTEFDSWQFLDPRTTQGIQLLTAPDALPPWERAFPLRNFLHWAYAAQGRRLLHAGTLGIGEKGVLLAGAGGAGKSGTTLSGLITGLKSVGDDYIALDSVSDRVIAYPVMRLMKQDPRGLARLGLMPETHRFGPLNWQGKHEFDFNNVLHGSRAGRLKINAVLLPRITGATRSTLQPATAHEVMFALLPNNLQQLPGQFKQGMGFLARLTRILPGYHLRLGTDPAEIADKIADFLERDM